MANRGSVPAKNLSVDAERRRTGFSRGANQFVRIASRLQAEKRKRKRGCSLNARARVKRRGRVVERFTGWSSGTPTTRNSGENTPSIRTVLPRFLLRRVEDGNKPNLPQKQSLGLGGR